MLRPTGHSKLSACRVLVAGSNQTCIAMADLCATSNTNRPVLFPRTEYLAMQLM